MLPHRPIFPHAVRNMLLSLPAAAILALLGFGFGSAGYAADTPPVPESKRKRPALIITNNAIREKLPDSLYQRPFKARETKAEDISGDSYFEPMQTVVTRKIGGLNSDLDELLQRIGGLSDKLTLVEGTNESMAAQYNASVATISTQLQTGTTPGNPRLIKRLGVAQNNLERLALNVADLNSLAVEVTNAASMAGFLLEATRATYGLSGAIEEDHAQLAGLEDNVSSAIVAIERLLGQVNDDITRSAAYLSSERQNLRALSLAVTNGDMYGKSLASRPFSQAQRRPGTPPTTNAGRPLVKIRFEEPNVAYEQPVYMAVSEAMQRFPQARFELIAVHPSEGNAARAAIESTRARRNAERVLRTLTQMGLSLDRVDLSYMPSREARTNEVHLFIR